MLISGYCEEKRPTIEAKETYVCVWVQHSKLTNELVRVCMCSVCVSVCLLGFPPRRSRNCTGGGGAGIDGSARFQRGRQGEREREG
jgi:hypothetical protein